MKWETVIGLEIHAQLATKSKLFSSASTAHGTQPNTQACAVDIGLPGVLPVLNQDAVYMAVKFGIAINANISSVSVFVRKNYFYPDLPKGYQISQMDRPIVGAGHMTIEIEGKTKRIGITRAHLEEDAGKSLHEAFHGFTGLDLNRAGTPLLEIVSEPDMRSAKEAVTYMRKIHKLVRYIEICDGNMQEGSLRCDVNVSIRPKGQKTLGVRAELKNLNSFKFVEKAINIEVERQINLIESGDTVIQETRLYDADKNETRPMRGKEEVDDYRYFPDPDLLPVKITDELKQQIVAELPELPDAKKQRFMTNYNQDDQTATILTSSRQLADFYETVVQQSGCTAKLCTNWVTGNFLNILNKNNLSIAETPVSSKNLAGLLQRITDNTISEKIAKQVFESMWKNQATADAIIESQGLKQITDNKVIEAIVDEIIRNNPKQVAQYLNGKDKVFGFFVGQVMRATKGQANPSMVNNVLKSKLS